MSHARIFRYQSPAELAQQVAEKLVSRLAQLLDEREMVNLVLTGGRVAGEVYRHLGAAILDSGLDITRLHLWWSDERFVGTTSPDRNSQQSLAILGQTMKLVPSQTHLMPSQDGKRDPGEAAFDYATQLKGVHLDICLLGIGEDGHVASIFPNHPSFDPMTTLSVIGVTDSPKPPPERISMTLPMLNGSDEIWVIASGEGKAEAVAKGISADPSVPAGHLNARQKTYWFMDLDAAKLLPYYNCLL